MATCSKESIPTDANKAKFKLTLVLTYWIRINTVKMGINQFPLDILQLIVNVFLDKHDTAPLPFHQAFRSSYVQLRDYNKLAKCSSHACYVLADCPPVINGFSAWRVKVL